MRAEPDNMPIIDVNITLGQWPLRRVPCDEIDALAAKLREHDVAEAWAGSYDGLFHDDLAAVNDRLAEACGNAPAGVNFRPFGEINPAANGWEAELQRCVETHRMRGIRLHPNYHGYALDHPNFARLLQAAAERQLVVQLVAMMEDARMMHAQLRVPPVDLAPLHKLVPNVPQLKLVLLNALATTSRTDSLFRLIDAGNVYVEIALLEGVGGIGNVLKDIPAERILFGSHAPSLYLESAVLKLRESALPESTRRMICDANARRLVGG